MERARAPRSGVLLVAALVVGLLFSASAHAAPGDLDPTFSGDGKQTTDFPFGVSEASATVSQPDGKVVAVGSVLRATSRDSGFNDFAVARYNPNGSLDTSFSGDGKQTTDFNGLDDGATGVALQSDGKIVVVGRTGFFDPFGSSFDFAIARYNPDGSLDSTFSGDGKQRVAFGDDAQANGMAIQDDGKIVAVGRTCSGNPDIACDSALARLNADGSPDTSFSGDGQQTTDFGSVSEHMNGVALQADGKIIASGGSGGDGSGAVTSRCRRSALSSCLLGIRDRLEAAHRSFYEVRPPTAAQLIAGCFAAAARRLRAPAGASRRRRG